MRHWNVNREPYQPLRYLLVLAASAVVGMSGAALAAPLTVEDASIAKSTDHYDVEVHYPRTGLTAVDSVVSSWATGLVDDFVKQAEEDFASFANDSDRPDWTYSLDLNYEVARNDGEMFVVGFNEDIFTGGAHPNHDIETFNFLTPDGW
jgi:Deacetylase PdaC